MINVESLRDKSLVEGNYVKWHYWHVIGRSGHWVVKRGIFRRYNADKTKAFILLEGNARGSWKKLEDVSKIEGV